MTAVTGALLRAYNVGFGDCMLLTLTYADDTRRNVLIDFGTTELPKSAARSRMADVAADIEAQTGGKLDMLVATHRHADHISGFGNATTGPIIEKLKPDVVVQPWTEAPDLPTNARQRVGSGQPAGHHAFARTLHSMQAFAAGARAEGLRLQRLGDFPVSVANRLRFFGETNLKNEEAVRRLMGMDTEHIYAASGDNLTNDSVLPGVKIDVLGPPTLAQHDAIARQARTDKEEFWHLAASWALAAQEGNATASELNDVAGPLFPDHVTRRIPQAAKWLLPRIDRTYADEMLSLLRIMDNVLNNTSLILLLRIGGTTLLFPGDAQLENWGYSLFRAPNRRALLNRLARTDVYKVGHHGSLNATPKTVWNNFAKLSDDESPDRLISVVSTHAGKHGSPGKGTEVPRKPLMDALKAQSTCKTTQNLRSNKKPWLDVPIPLR